MHQRVGRAAQRQQHAHGVLDRLDGEHLRRPHGFNPCASRPASSAMRSRSECTAGALAPSSGMKPRVATRQAMVAGGAHHAAGAGGHRQRILDFVDALLGHITGAVARPVAPAIGAGGQPLALVAIGTHRPRDQHHRRHVGADRGHQLRRHGLVAAADEDHGIHRLGAHHRLGVERHEVAVVHRARREERLAQADGGEGHGQAAGEHDAALHRLDQVGDGAVAVVEVRCGIDDARHRAAQRVLRIAHGGGEAAAEVKGEFAVAVIGGVAA